MAEDVVHNSNACDLDAYIDLRDRIIRLEEQVKGERESNAKALVLAKTLHDQDRMEQYHQLEMKMLS